MSNAFLKQLVRLCAYPFLSVYFRLFPVHADVMDIAQTVDALLSSQKSLVRFGDGEMQLMQGRSICYQRFVPELSEALRDILRSDRDDLLVAIPDIFSGLRNQTARARLYWKCHLFLYKKCYASLPRRIWGNANVSRPYMDYRAHMPCGIFSRIQLLWEDRDILVVEGSASRNGSGNDLFAGARSVRRVICPAADAFCVREKVESFVRDTVPRDTLILLSLGPAAKVIASDLSLSGWRCIDIGHLDVEYEWFRMGATKKVPLSSKHTAEHDDISVSLPADASYSAQIAADFSSAEEA